MTTEISVMYGSEKVNYLTADPDYIRFFIFFYLHIKYHLLSMLEIKRDINGQYLKIVNIHFVKSVLFSLTWSYARHNFKWVKIPIE